MSARPTDARAQLLPALSAAALLSCGCASWSRSAIAPEAQVEAKKSVRVHLKDGRKLKIEQPRVVGDSLVGYAEAALPFDPPRHRDVRKPGPRVAVALADIVSLDVRKTSASKTAGFVVLLAAIGFLAVGLAFASAFDGPYF